MTCTEPTNIQWTRSDLDLCVVKFAMLRVALFSKPSFAPPVLAEMMPDITRLMHSVAARFSDQTTPQLQHDELVGMSRLKLAEIITNGQVESQATRECFFKFFKTAINNQACSLVQKYRFTEKRTGVKPPPRKSRVYNNAGVRVNDDDDDDTVVPEHHKNVELSLDDEELNLQVPDAGACDEDAAYDELATDYQMLLTEQEQFIFRKLTHPGVKAAMEAECDARRGKAVGKPFCIRITHDHLAKEAGIPLKLFEEYVLSIRQKIAAYRAMSDIERHQLARRGALLGQLNEVFGLQIPPDTDDMLVRRILTISARDQFHKVRDNKQVAEMLEEIGAKVPQLQGNNQLGCYGVLFQRSSRVCLKCDLRKSCSVEAANVGLGKIVLSPRLLGSRQTRTPVILPRLEDEPQALPSPEELDWMSYVDETFSKQRKRDGCYFCFSPDEDKERRPLFFIDAKPPYRLRFINPSDDLKLRLITHRRSWYPPERSANVDICALVDQHSEEQLKLIRADA